MIEYDVSYDMIYLLAKLSQIKVFERQVHLSTLNTGKLSKRDITKCTSKIERYRDIIDIFGCPSVESIRTESKVAESLGICRLCDMYSYVFLSL